MAEAYIIDAVRTPRGIGKVGKGALAHMHPQHLAATVLSALAERNKLDTATVDDIIWGTSSQRGACGCAAAASAAATCCTVSGQAAGPGQGRSGTGSRLTARPPG